MNKLKVDNGLSPAPAEGQASAIDAGRADKIVAAADQLLEEHGLEGLTIRAVLDRTGLSRRAFYDRFAGKDDLVLAVFETTLQIAAEHFERQYREEGDPMLRLRGIVDSIVIGQIIDKSGAVYSTDKRSAAMSREHLRLAEARPADLQAALRPLIALIENILAEGIARGQVRDAPVDRLAMLFYNVVSTTAHGELMAAESGNSDVDRRTRLAADIWEFCRRAIAA